MKTRYTDIEQYISDLPIWMQSVFQEVRMLLLTFPEIKEKLRYNAPFYDCTERMMLYLGVFEKKRFVLGFCHGHLIPDEAGKLKNEKNQTQIRHFEFYPQVDFDKAILVSYIQKAILLNQQLAESKHATPKNSRPK